MTALDAIFLDLDGCLVDSTRAITNTFDHALASVGLAPRAPEVTRSFIGPPLRATFDRIVAEEGRDPVLAVELVARYRERYRAMSAIETETAPMLGMAESAAATSAALASTAMRGDVATPRTRHVAQALESKVTRHVPAGAEAAVS